MLLHKVRNICKRENDHTNNSGNVNNHSLTFLIIKTIKKQNKIFASPLWAL